MYPRLLLGDDGAVGAGVAAGTAVQASGSIDDVLVIALADSPYCSIQIEKSKYQPFKFYG